MTVEERLKDFYHYRLQKRHPLVPPRYLAERAEELAQEELEKYGPDWYAHHLIDHLRRVKV